MNAHVQSLESINAVRGALTTFADQVRDALVELDAEMRRVSQWLQHDRPRHWKTQIRQAGDELHEAQQALHRCLMFPVAGERPSCYEERAALKRAQARLAYCEQKAERVRHWQRTLEHELFEYEGRISQLVRVVEIDAPQAIGVLHKIVRHLEEYQSLRANNPRTAYDELAVARAVWPADEASSGEAACSDAPSAAGTNDDVTERDRADA